MQSFRYSPAAPLSGYIDSFWYRRGYAPQRRRERALPGGSVDVTFNLHEDRIRMFRDAADREGLTVNGAIVHGAQSRYFVLDARKDVHVVGVHFRPGGGVLLGLPASELRDRHLALEDIWGVQARCVREQLLEAGEPRAMFRVLEREFLRRLQLPLLVNPAISFALRQFDSSRPLRIEAVQHATGYGERRFVALFDSIVGLTPKLYSRVQRLKRAVAQIAVGKSELAQIALDHGFYDQSHLTREFREFAGVTPGAYRPVPDRDPLHAEVDTR